MSLLVEVSSPGSFKTISAATELKCLVYYIPLGPQRTPVRYASVILKTLCVQPHLTLHQGVDYCLIERFVPLEDKIKCLSADRVLRYFLMTDTHAGGWDEFVERMYLRRIESCPEDMGFLVQAEARLYRELLEVYGVDLAYHSMVFQWLVNQRLDLTDPECVQRALSYVQATTGLTDLGPLDKWSYADAPPTCMHALQQQIVRQQQRRKRPLSDEEKKEEPKRLSPVDHTRHDTQDMTVLAMWEMVTALNQRGVYERGAGGRFIPIKMNGGWFKKTHKQSVFMALVNYVTGGDPAMGEAHLGLPKRNVWMGQPIMLMDDSLKSHTVFSYVICDVIGMFNHWQTATAPCCWNEVFVPGRPVYNLNLDIDMKLSGEPLADNWLELLITDFKGVLIETTTKMVGGGENKIPLKYCGGFTVYHRKKAMPQKVTLRIVYRPPLQLCFANLAQAQVFVKLLASYSLFTRYLCQAMFQDENGIKFLYDPFAERWTGLFEEAKPVVQMLGVKGQKIILAKAQKVNPAILDKLSSRYLDSVVSVIDAAPYAHHKSVRLPQCDKPDQGGRFQLIGSYNEFIHDGCTPSFADPSSPCSGLSALSLNIQRGCIPHISLTPFVEQATPPQATVAEALPLTDEALEDTLYKLSQTYKVTEESLTVKAYTNGVLVVTTQPIVCPLHCRVHNHSKPSFYITARRVYPRCYVDAPLITPSSINHYLALEWNELTSSYHVQSFVGV
uniref:Helicase-primase primase subunit n=1 Tax=Lake sturgeon herpesvirus TaxID=2922427 RepID=A0A9E9JWK6_9VIRU|nr:helicase-primase primase subunit [Lake sturgeon herpesvirus]